MTTLSVFSSAHNSANALSGSTWLLLVLLGAYHGLNPAMGWLFALALGLQEKSRSAVVRALPPIALGHAVAIAIAILFLRLLQDLLSRQLLKLIFAGILVALGTYLLFRARHPRGAGLRAGAGDLFVWSFLMASAHGAGLMITPILLAQPMLHISSHTMSTDAAAPLPAATILFAVVIHTVSLLIVIAVLALVLFQTYQRFGLKILRHAWFNFDLLWACALLIAGLITLVL
jgi:multisubunit Na+/H+ antiporter MnhC subunit